MVSVVQTIYPKFDKTLQSKCERGDVYGIAIRNDAMNALLAKFAPEAGRPAERRKGDRHRLTCRVSCRLSEDEFRLLQQHVKTDGFGTMQTWLADQIQKYLKGRESDECKDKED
jgi:hypothetical protein